MTTAVVCPEKTVWALLVSNRHAHVSIIISWQRFYMKKSRETMGPCYWNKTPQG